MIDRAEILRQRIAYYRRRLAEGVNGGLAQLLMSELIADERELAAIEADSERRD